MRSLNQDLAALHPPPPQNGSFIYTNRSWGNSSYPSPPGPPPQMFPPPADPLAAPPPPETIYDAIIGVDNAVSDSAVTQSMWVCVVLGTLCVMAFSIVHNRWKFYKIRLYLDSVTVRPPAIETPSSLWSWMYNVMMVNDLQLLETAGLDALMLVKVVGLGVKIFAPFTFIGLLVLVPMHRFTSAELSKHKKDIEVKLSMYSMANLQDGHPMFWLHFVLTYLYIFYVMLLLRWQYYNYVKLRQNYMIAGTKKKNRWYQAVTSFNKRQQFQNLMANLEMMRDYKRTLTTDDEETTAAVDSLDPDQIQTNLPTSRQGSSISQLFRAALTPVSRAMRSSTSFARANPLAPPTTQTMPSPHTPGLLTPTLPAPPKPMDTLVGRTPSDTQRAAADQSTGLRSTSKSSQLPPLFGERLRKQTELVPVNNSANGSVSSPHGNGQMGRQVQAGSKSEGTSSEVRGSNASVSGPQPVAEGWEFTSKTPKDKFRRTDSLPVATKEGFEPLASQASSECTQSNNSSGQVEGPPSSRPDTARSTSNTTYSYDTIEGAKWWRRVLILGSGSSERRMLSKPSVRHRTTVNTIARDGSLVSVNAAQYTVLVTDVQDPDLERKVSVKYRFSLAERAVARLPPFLAVPILRYVFLTDPERDELRTYLAISDETTDKIVRVEKPAARAINVNAITSTLTEGEDFASPAGQRCRSFMSNTSTRPPSFAVLHSREYPVRPPPIVIPNYTSPRSNSSPQESARATSDIEFGALSPTASSAHLIKPPPPVPQLKFPQVRASTPLGEGGCFGGGTFRSRHSREEGVDVATKQQHQSLESPPFRPNMLPTVPSGLPVEQHWLQQPYQHYRYEDRPPYSSVSRSSSATRKGFAFSRRTSKNTEAESSSKWVIVKDAILDGRLFRLPPDIVTETFRKLFPNDFDRAVPVFRFDQVDRLLLQWDFHQRSLEHAVAIAQAQGIEPEERVCCDGCCLCCNCCACCSLKREKVKSIPHHMGKIKELEAKIKVAQREAYVHGKTPSYIVFFRTQMGATLAANSVFHAEDQTKFQVHAAPGPENVNWEVLWFTYAQREARSYLAWPVKFIILVFPISVLSGALTSLDSSLCGKDKLHQLWPYYCEEKGFPGLLRMIVTGLLPSVLLSIWQNMVIPRSLHFVAQMESQSVSLSGLEQRMLSLYYIWSVANVVQGVLGQVLMGTILEIIKNPATIISGMFNVLGQQLPMASNFFFNYVWFRGVTMLPFRLLVPHMGFWCFLVQLGGRLYTWSPRDYVDLYTTRSIRHGIELGLLLYIFTVGFVYCLVSPLLNPVVLAYFLCAYILWRNSVLYLNVRKYESGGSLWPRVFDRLLVGLLLFQLFMTSLMLVKQAYYQSIILLLTVPFILKKFHTHCHMTFEMGVKCTPLELAKQAPAARVDPLIYIPPPLQPGCMGWHPEWMKAWEGFGQPMYTA